MSQTGSPEQHDAAASARATSAAAAAATPDAQGEVSNANLILIALTAGLGLALITIGLWNAVLVVAFSILLTCNPWVRTLLELPSTDGKRGLGTFDPARYLLSYTASSTDQANDDDGQPLSSKADDESLARNDQLYELTVMPPALRQSSHTMIRFVVRDFVQGWYDRISFAHPNFPISAEANISHVAASVYLRARQLKSNNIAAEILLTAQSVLLSSLRRRRISTRGSSSPSSSARSTWPSTAARIDALRKAVRKFLSRNLAHAERSSPVLMLLLTEIVAKQAWEVAQTIGDPDFINQKIVEWADPASETSLEGQAISPEELERLQSLDTAALDAQAAEALQAQSGLRRSSSSAGGAAQARNAAPSRPSTATSQSSPSPARHIDATQHTPRHAQEGSIGSQTSAVDRSSATASSSRSNGPSLPPRPRVTPPRKSNSSGPLSAIGGFATGAFGALADAAERAVDVVGGTVDEFGNLLIAPAESSPRNQSTVGSGSARASPRSRQAVLVERDSNAPDSNKADQRRSGGGDGHLFSNAAQAYHLDMPRDIVEPPLPESLRQSLRDARPQSSADDDAHAFVIPDTPERSTMASPSLVAPAPVAAALNLAPRSSLDDRGPDDSSWPAMYQLLSDRSSPAYDAFETFLEHPSNRFCAPNEGESLLRLHTQLDTLASIMEFATLDEQTFRADASTILSKALETLPSTLPPTHDGERPVLVRRSAQQVLTNLEWCANMDVVEPLRETIIARLVQLYNAFQVSGAQLGESAQSSPTASRYAALPRTDSPEPTQLRSSMDLDSTQFRYEPRRKTTAPSPLQVGMQTPPRAPSVPPGAGGSLMGPPSGLARPTSVPPRAPSAPPKAQQMVVPGTASHPPASRSSTDLPSNRPQTRVSDAAHPSTSSGPVISVTDISANADTSRPVDVRMFEVMISVEGVDTSSDGHVLVRRWHEFEQMDAEVQRQPRSTHPLPRLPAVKGRRSVEACRLLEGYLGELLGPGNRVQMEGVAGAKSFFDRTRAGASVEDLRRKGAGAFLGGIGKGIVSGVGLVGKQAARTGSTGVQALSTGMRNADPSSDGLPPPPRSASSHSPLLGSDSTPTRTFVANSPALDSASSTTSAFVSRTNSPSPPRPTRPAPEMSARQLDMLLSSLFAVADEAFNLQGGWTLRRGMLRVLEQVVRTTYASSIVAGFNSSAASLNTPNFARWIEDLTNSLWPGGRAWGSEVGTVDEKRPRTEVEKSATADKAREIVVSYAPAQAGYLLGPGGKVACVKALAEVHATLMDPITASDLALTVVLKALDMASR